MSDWFYRTVQTLGAPFRFRCTGAEHIRDSGPAIFIANHLGAIGPLQSILAVPQRLYPWVIAEMTDPARAPRYLYDDVVQPAWHLSGRPGRAVASVVSRFAVGLLRGLDAISVDGNRGWTTPAFRRSLALLAQGRSLLIFPEDPKLPEDPETKMHVFRPGFAWLCYTHQQKTGREVPVYPVAVAPRPKIVAIGAPLFLELAGAHRAAYARFARSVEDTVRGMLLSLNAVGQPEEFDPR